MLVFEGGGRLAIGTAYSPNFNQYAIIFAAYLKILWFASFKSLCPKFRAIVLFLGRSPSNRGIYLIFLIFFRINIFKHAQILRRKIFTGQKIDNVILS